MLYLICLLKRLGSNLCQFLIWQYHSVLAAYRKGTTQSGTSFDPWVCCKKTTHNSDDCFIEYPKMLVVYELGMLFMDMVHLPPPEALWMLQPFLSLSLLVLPNKQFLKFLDIHPKKIWPVGEWLPPRFYIKKKSSHTDRENSTNPTSTYTQGLITSENDSWADH
jgi:hypothetical protein